MKLPVGVGAAVIAVELTCLVAVSAYARRWNPDVGGPPYRRPEAPFATREDVGRPIADSIVGLTMFRGNATRTFYGRGPIPRAPRILWRYPDKRMCAISVVAHQANEWCGSGWTGQPAVVERAGDSIEVIVGTYDRAVHFIDGATGHDRRQPFPTNDIIKGSVSVDPDGYPLVYSGSRDNYFHIIALDRPKPTEIWRLWAYDVPRPMWNDDWDGNAVVHDDYLFEGGENGWYYVFKLNRHYDADGHVQVSPVNVAQLPSFDDSLLADIKDREVSIENSTAIYGWTAYFANSGGAIWGLDLHHARTDSTTVRPVFRYWTGDDTDASIVIDEDGMLYVASELQRFNRRSAEVGQLEKLDPRHPDNPRVWGIQIPPGGGEPQGGIWATPALFGHMLYVATNSGRLLGVDRDSGTIRWELPLPHHAWSSPVVVDSTLIVADCQGSIHAYDVHDPLVSPPELWTFHLPSGACIESTPAVWKGRLYVGARDGYFYAIGDQ